MTQTARRLLSSAVPVLALGLGLGAMASAQSASPFATKKKRQAWETPAPAAAPAPSTSQTAPAGPPPGTSAPTPSPTYAPTPAPRYSTPASVGGATDWSALRPTTSPPAYPEAAPATNTLPQGYTTRPSATRPAYTEAYPATGTAAPLPPGYTGDPGAYYGTEVQRLPRGAQAQPYPPSQAGPQDYTQPRPPARRGLVDRLGLRNLSTLLTGGLRGGVAARDRSDAGWEEAFVGDADLEAEVSAITDGGLEYGLNLQARAQYDPQRRGFTRRLPDCPPTVAGCASLSVNGVPVGLRGHTSQFYTTGPDVADDVQLALESAHLFLRSAYGDVTVGRDDGAAYLFSLGAPTTLNVGASNSGVDYTGLDAVKTVNDASGFAEKVTYTSPRLLGDRIGVGVQLGVSYAPDPYACGVDYCVERAGVTDVLTPDLEDVLEAGLALDRTFRNGLSVEGTVTYARASEISGLAGLDDLSSVGAGVEVSLSDWTAGGSWLSSNQGVAGGDYTAWDAGLTWEPGPWGFTLGYGRATDDLVSLSSDQITAGVSYTFRERFTLGAGVQHADRETLRDVAGTAQLGDESATALFIEGGFTF